MIDTVSYPSPAMKKYCDDYWLISHTSTSYVDKWDIYIEEK
jgi:hypothetical protein